MTRRRRLIGGAMVIVLAVLAAVVGIWLWQATQRPGSAADAATAYLRALESGDPVAVESTGIVVSPEALTAFSAATGLIQDAGVTGVTDDGDDAATADIVFRLGDEKHSARLTLSDDDGRWIVDASALGTVTATTTIGGFVGVGDARLPVGEEVRLLPAEYAVAAAPSALLEGEAVLRVLPAESAEVAIEAALRPDATDVAQQQLDAHLEKCTAPGSAPPDGCGIRIPWGTEFRAVSEIRYRIEQSPTIALTPAGFTADGGVLVATVTGTGQDGGARTTTYRTDSWSLRGDVTFTADELVLTAW